MARKKRDNKNTVDTAGAPKSSRMGVKCNKENVRKNKIVKLKMKKKIRRRYKERQYTEESLKDALKAIERGKSLRQASVLFGVPKSTLHIKLNSEEATISTKGAPTVLTAQEESEIAEWIIFCAERGFPVTKDHLLDRVQKFVISSQRDNPFRENRPGKHWYNGFMKRHSNLTKRIAQNLTSSRAAVTAEDLMQWFESVRQYLEKKNLLDLDSERIFNLDESAFMLVPKDNTVITRKGAKAVYQIVSGNEKASLTVLFTAAASGKMPPPMILFDLKTSPKKSVLDNIPQGWGVGNSERGWMTSETFYSYIANVFYKWLIDNKYEFPVILYVDGHSSHLTLPLMRFCKQHSIEIIALYPNATHIIQPLDVALFHPLKDAYKKTLRTWRIENDVVDFKKHMFAKVLKLTLDSIDLSTALKNGFKSCGLYPFNPKAVNYNVLTKNKKKSNVSSSSSSDSSAQNQESLSNNDNLRLLQLFETNILSDVLEEFKLHEFEESWSGDITQKALFESWQKLKQLCDKEDEASANFRSSNSLKKSVDSATFNSSSSSISIPSNSPVQNFEVVEDTSVPCVQISVQETDSNPILSFEDVEYIDSPIIEMASGIETNIWNPNNVQSIDEFGQQSIITIESVPPESAHDNTLETEILPISEADLLDENLLSNIISIEEPSINSTIQENSTTENLNANVHSLNDEEKSNSMDTGLEVSYPNDHVNSVTKDIKEVDFQNPCSNEDTSAPKILSLDQRINEESSDSLQDGILDLSMGQKDIIVNKTSDKKCEDAGGFKKIFTVPNFNSKSKKRKLKSEGTVPVSVVDDLLEVLEQKEKDKKLKEEQTLKNKKEKERFRLLREKEQNVNKNFQEQKKKLVQEKRSINVELKGLKKLLKSEDNKENKDQLLKKQEELCKRLEEVEKLSISHEMEVLQTKIKIKQEKL